MARSRSLLHPAVLLALSTALVLAALALLLVAAPLGVLLYLARRLQRGRHAAPAGRTLEGEFRVVEHSPEQLDARAWES